MTFQDLIDKIGIDNVFLNTSVDLATQNCLLEWFFDYDLCDSDDTTKWLRYFRRRINDVYPKYNEMVRVMTAKSNMDPFITEFMQKIHNTQDLKNKQLTAYDDTTKTTTYNTENNDNGWNHFSPLAERYTQYINIQDVHDRGPNGITNKTDYLNFKEDVTGASHSSNEESVSGDPYNTTNAVHNEGASRGVAIAYPEANMGSIGRGVNGGTSDVGYASSEQRNWDETDLGATRADQHLDERTKGKNQSSDETHKVTSGGYKQTEIGTDTNTRNGLEKQYGQGTDLTEFSDTKTKRGTDTNVTDGKKSELGQENGTSQGKEMYQGRHKSPAEILPQAIRAIVSTDEIKWLIDKMMICFDCYGRI